MRQTSRFRVIFGPRRCANGGRDRTGCGGWAGGNGRSPPALRLPALRAPRGAQQLRRLTSAAVVAERHDSRQPRLRKRALELLGEQTRRLRSILRPPSPLPRELPIGAFVDLEAKAQRPDDPSSSRRSSRPSTYSPRRIASRASASSRSSSSVSMASPEGFARTATAVPSSSASPTSILPSTTRPVMTLMIRFYARSAAARIAATPSKTEGGLSAAPKELRVLLLRRD
jgi:hypothetical protein